MAKEKNPRTEPSDEPSETKQLVKKVDEVTDRGKEMANDTEIEEELIKLYQDVEKGFEDQATRSDNIMDWWDCYNCKLNSQQFYNGTSQIYIPIIHDAIEARVIRFSNQLFPQGNRNVEASSSDGTGAIPHAEIALAESYIRKTKLRTQVIPSLLRNGDVEGHYTIYTSWQETTREVTWRKTQAPKIDELDEEMPKDLMDEDDKVETVEHKELVDGRPHIEVIADSDLLVLPSTADSISDALNQGGSVTIIRRWSKAKLKQMIKDKEIRKEEGKHLIDEMKKEQTSDKPDKAKEMADAAGIRGDGRGKFAQVYETWHMLTVDDERRIYRTYFGSPLDVLSCKRNPFWSDRLPILSAPVKKIQGAFKGRSQIQQVATLQYQANDAANEGMDSASYALMPIVMTDPESNPRVGSMILSMAAVWEVDPNTTKFAEFPALWKDALEIVTACRTQIFQTLNVNASQITQAGGQKKKPNQAEVANEQQIDLLTTADAVTILEEEILTPLVSFIIEMDHQFRDTDMMVRAYGELGMKAEMVKVPPIQMDNAYQFRWFGVEQARTAQMIQQQIGFINVIAKIPPQAYPNHKMDLAPLLTQMSENVFGPRLAPLTFVDQRDELSIDPELENTWMLQNLVVPVHKMDDHAKHMQVHMKVLPMDQSGGVRAHMQAHMQALASAQGDNNGAKNPPPGGQPGQPPGAPPGGPPQQGSGPRAGASPMPPRGTQQPPGAIHADRMQDPTMAPRQ